MRRAPSTPPDLPGYTALQLLGSGGFADVFLYEQRLPRRKVAVKVLLTEELGRDTRAQFVAEANLMAQLSTHPFIVTIFHADVSADGRPYFVMEYCPGPSLAERYKRERFAVEDALRTGIRLAGAVATAHAAGILHRDIKPANVLTNDYGWPALTDFGISSNLEGELPVHTMTSPVDASSTSSGQSAVGMSVPWSPPEMFEDDPKPDQRSDVFSLAATVHSLLAGRTPFEIPGRPNGSLDLIGRIERGAITPIGRDDVPRSLTGVLAKGMATRREDRYPSAVEFARALQRVELELGYPATTIEVPNLASERQAPVEDGADETRARAVRSVEAQPAAPSRPTAVPGEDDATRARTPRQVEAQPVAATAATPDEGTIVRAPVAVAGTTANQVDQTVIRPRGRSAQAAAPAAEAAAAPTVDATQLRGRGAAASDLADDMRTQARPRRSRVGALVAIVAAIVVVVVIGIAVALSGTLEQPSADRTAAPSGEDAILAATVPAPVVQPGVTSADGASVSFAVSHDDAEEGDRYRWRRADGSGAIAVADGPTIIVDGVTAGERVCIEVQVQRGSKTSEPVTECTA
ncbi:serine/threonine protein kinase/predicted RNA-binding protein with TRAM domain [Agromyces sp. 3263]|uniref:serine/threonine-protein kinase n=1 Tax=Agromyces sp. 3263 TaxID=2817750 RepID=UPI0028656AA3|nr:serine/threonine-protein kinase [Agromyces sp. 3263]MDR6907648.1 serine/threonine protein kinase/predicted RNA-binding protein with TRAM domain [Agromyces sp. 3263]